MPRRKGKTPIKKATPKESSTAVRADTNGHIKAAEGALKNLNETGTKVTRALRRRDVKAADRAARETGPAVKLAKETFTGARAAVIEEKKLLDGRRRRWRLAR